MPIPQDEFSKLVKMKAALRQAGIGVTEQPSAMLTALSLFEASI